MGIQLHKGFTPFDVSFPVAARAFEEFGIDGVTGPQFSECCPFGNTGTSMGSPRRHGELLLSSIYLFPDMYQCMWQLNLDSFWDSVKSLGVGGMNYLPLPYFLLAASHPQFFLDSPEIGPGALIGVSSSTTGAGPTPGGSPHPTTFPGPGSSPLSAPTSSPSYGSSSSGRGSLNTGVIVGAAVGGTSVIALAILASIYLRKSRPTPPSAAVVVGYGASLQPPHDVKMPLPPDDRSHDASSLTLQTQTPIPPMRVYVCFFLFSCLCCVSCVRAHFLSCTQSPNESSRSSVYPEYQEAPSPRAPEVSALPTSFSAYKVTNIPATEQGEYHGLPIV